MHSTSIGNIGEQLAAEALVRAGYEILERNWKIKAAEIDIVAKKKDVIYFAEVKFRQTSLQGDGFDYITDKKLWHMHRAAELWTSQTNWDGEYCLLAVAVSGDGSDADIREIA